MYSAKQRLVAIITCVAIIFFTSFSMFVIPHELHHDCCGEDCPICACIHLVEQTVHGLDIALASLVPMFAIVVLVCSCVADVNSGMPSCSLIKEKVRMNN